MKVKYHILFLLLTGLFAQACNTNEPKEPERNDLKITASAESIVLDGDNISEKALTFSWNKATSLGDEYTFSYLFQVDIADNDFATATDYVTLGEDGSYSFTNAELYDLIVEKWGQVAGAQIAIEARIAAKVDGPKFVYPEIATTRVYVTTYIPDSQPLYLIGTATEAGLDPTKGIKMNERSNGNIYDWSGSLQPGNFKFITRLGHLYPAYEKGATANTIVEREEEGSGASYFEITEAGTYYIYLSMKDMSVTYQRSKYDVIYIVGDGCDAGWEFTKTLEQDPVNLNIYTYQGALKAGELKFIVGDKWEDPTFRPMVENGSIQSDAVQLTEGGADLKWKIMSEEAGDYLITLDVDAMKINFEKQ